MHIEFLIEDYSGGEALKEFLPQCLVTGTTYEVHNFSGKQDLLKKLPDRLKGYKTWIPDAIQGGTWEALERVLQKYHPGGLDKPKAAREIARHMNPEVNRSKSFQAFYLGLKTWQERYESLSDS